MIKRIISTERQEWIVITSDRDIASEAWRCGSIPISSEVFYEKLFDPYKQAQADKGYYDEPDEPDIGSGPPYKHKGNPHRFSKKEKAIRRAISKL